MSVTALMAAERGRGSASNLPPGHEFSVTAMTVSYPHVTIPGLRR